MNMALRTVRSPRQPWSGVETPVKQLTASASTPHLGLFASSQLALFFTDHVRPNYPYRNQNKGYGEAKELEHGRKSWVKNETR